MLGNWWTYVIIYLIANVVFTQGFKIITKTSKKDGALTVFMESLAALVSIALIPFFVTKWPSDPKVYLLIGLAFIFFAIKDRMITTVRKNLEASTVNILEQVSNIFLIVWGVMFFKEAILWQKILGAGLIIFSNVLIFYQKGKWVVNKYVILGAVANVLFSVALAIGIGISDQFNIAIYQVFVLFVPALLIFLFEKLSIKDMQEEWKQGNKKALLITGISWAIMGAVQLRAMQLGSITTVAPLCAVAVILNVVAGYLLLKEKGHLWKKLLAAMIIVLGVMLIK